MEIAEWVDLLDKVFIPVCTVLGFWIKSLVKKSDDLKDEISDIKDDHNTETTDIKMTIQRLNDKNETQKEKNEEYKKLIDDLFDKHDKYGVDFRNMLNKMS